MIKDGTIVVDVYKRLLITKGFNSYYDLYIFENNHGTYALDETEITKYNTVLNET